MKILLDTEFPRTVDRLVQEWPGRFLEAWVFEDESTRCSVKASLAAVGITARLQSAYKPLLHFFLEEVELTGLSAATVRTPSHLLATPGRFELETFLLARLLPGMALGSSPDPMSCITM